MLFKRTHTTEQQVAAATTAAMKTTDVPSPSNINGGKKNDKKYGSINNNNNNQQSQKQQHNRIFHHSGKRMTNVNDSCDDDELYTDQRDCSDDDDYNNVAGNDNKSWKRRTLSSMYRTNFGNQQQVNRRHSKKHSFGGSRDEGHASWVLPKDSFEVIGGRFSVANNNTNFISENYQLQSTTFQGMNQSIDENRGKPEKESSSLSSSTTTWLKQSSVRKSLSSKAHSGSPQKTEIKERCATPIHCPPSKIYRSKRTISNSSNIGKSNSNNNNSNHIEWEKDGSKIDGHVSSQTSTLTTKTDDPVAICGGKLHDSDKIDVISNNSVHHGSFLETIAESKTNQSDGDDSERDEHAAAGNVQSTSGGQNNVAQSRIKGVSPYMKSSTTSPLNHTNMEEENGQKNPTDWMNCNSCKIMEIFFG
jgi:hypothetical protein